LPGNACFIGDGEAPEAFLVVVGVRAKTISLKAVVPDFGVLTGPSVITDLPYGDAHGDDATLSIRLSSAGLIVSDAHGRV
jgi:predicted secreted protein